MITAALQAEIEKELKNKIVSIAPLSAANNAQIYRLTVDKAGPCVAKVAERGLDIEAWMLRYLKEHSNLPVPQIYYANEHVIIMSYVESHHQLDGAAQRDAAQHLAALHAIPAPTYGFERDTLVGAMRQPNTPAESWAAFFAEHRLLYMAREALSEGKIDAKMMKLAERVAGKVAGIVGVSNPPGLVHGDIWGGNVLPGRGCVAAFVDPAIYFADPEMELAWIRLFSTFDGSFFARYAELRPIKPGFEERADLYSLYPLLVHTRLFGASYARKAQKVLERFA